MTGATSHSSARSSPSAAKQLTVIDASKVERGESFEEIFRYRDLLLILAQRDIQVRYRQAAIGIAWALLRPAATVLIFVTFFWLLGRQPSTTGTPYAAAVLIGYVTWMLFAAIVIDCSSSLVKNRHILTKVYFPRVLIPIAAMAVGLVDYLVALIPSALILYWMGVHLAWPILTLPLWLSGVILLAFAIGLALSAINVRYRDVEHAVPFLLQVGLYVSPVIYETAAVIPERYQWIYRLNPLANFLDGLRWSLVNSTPPDWRFVALSVCVTFFGLFLAWRLFHRMDASVSDQI